LTSIQNEDQQEFWQDSWTFLHCFSNEQGEDLKVSGISDQIFVPVYFKEN